MKKYFNFIKESQDNKSFNSKIIEGLSFYLDRIDEDEDLDEIKICGVIKYNGMDFFGEFVTDLNGEYCKSNFYYHLDIDLIDLWDYIADREEIDYNDVKNFFVKEIAPKLNFEPDPNVTFEKNEYLEEWVIISKDYPFMSFLYDHTEDFGDEIKHYGTLTINTKMVHKFAGMDHEFGGYIECDANGDYLVHHFQGGEREDNMEEIEFLEESDVLTAQDVEDFIIYEILPELNNENEKDPELSFESLKWNPTPKSQFKNE
jgi:hypothetical protein